MLHHFVGEQITTLPIDGPHVPQGAQRHSFGLAQSAVVVQFPPVATVPAKTKPAKPAMPLNTMIENNKIEKNLDNI